MVQPYSGQRQPFLQQNRRPEQRPGQGVAAQTFQRPPSRPGGPAAWAGQLNSPAWGGQVNNPFLRRQVQQAQQGVTQNFQDEIMPALNAVFANAGGVGGGQHQLLARDQANDARDAMSNIATQLYGNAYEGEQNRATQRAGIGANLYTSGEDRSQRESQFGRQLGLDTELGRGNLGVSRGHLGVARDRLALDRELGTGRIALDTELGRGGLDVQREGLGLQRYLGDRGFDESAADRGLRRYTADRGFDESAADRGLRRYTADQGFGVQRRGQDVQQYLGEQGFGVQRTGAGRTAISRRARLRPATLSRRARLRPATLPWRPRLTAYSVGGRTLQQYLGEQGWRATGLRRTASGARRTAISRRAGLRRTASGAGRTAISRRARLTAYSVGGKTYSNISASKVTAYSVGGRTCNATWGTRASSNKRPTGSCSVTWGIVALTSKAGASIWTPPTLTSGVICSGGSGKINCTSSRGSSNSACSRPCSRPQPKGPAQGNKADLVSTSHQFRNS